MKAWTTEGAQTAKYCSEPGAYIKYKKTSNLAKTLSDFNKADLSPSKRNGNVEKIILKLEKEKYRQDSNYS